MPIMRAMPNRTKPITLGNFFMVWWLVGLDQPKLIEKNLPQKSGTKKKHRTKHGHASFVFRWGRSDFALINLSGTSAAVIFCRITESINPNSTKATNKIKPG